MIDIIFSRNFITITNAIKVSKLNDLKDLLQVE